MSTDAPQASSTSARFAKHPGDRGLPLVEELLGVLDGRILLIQLGDAVLVHERVEFRILDSLHGRVAEDYLHLCRDVLVDDQAQRAVRDLHQFFAAFDDGRKRRDLRVRAQRLVGADRKELQVAALDIGSDSCVVGVRELDLLAENRGDALAAARICGQSRLIAELVEDQRLDVAGSAGAGVAHLDLAGVRLNIVKKLFDGVVLGILRDNDDLLVGSDRGDRSEVRLVIKSSTAMGSGEI